MNKLKEGCLYRKINGGAMAVPKVDEIAHVSFIEKDGVIMVLSSYSHTRNFACVLHKGRVCYIIGDKDPNGNKDPIKNRYELIEEQA